MTSKRILDNLDTGLWAAYGDGCIAAAWFDLGAWDEGGSYILQYYKEGFPPFNADSFQTADELETAMRAVQPDLRRWHTTFAS